MTTEVLELEDLQDHTEENNKMSQNHWILQARLPALLMKEEDKYTAATEVRLAIPENQLADIQTIFPTAKRELIPDICLYAADEFDLIDTIEELREDVIRTSQMPLLAIEILSPNDKIPDATRKIRALLLMGVKSCWLVSPDFKTIIVYSNSDAKLYDLRVDSELIDNVIGIKLPMQKIFATRKKNKNSTGC